jgi:hypothetical protein
MKSHSYIRCLAPFILLLAGTTASLAQTLNVTNGLQLWLKADAGVTTNAAGGVTQWNDQTTNANHAVQSTDAAAPRLITAALNNRPVLRFDGVDDSLAVPDSASLSSTGDVSSFFVIKFDDFATFRAVWGKTLGNLPAPTDIYALPNDGRLRVFRGNGAAVNTSTTTDQPLVAGSFLAVGFDVAGETLTHYLNHQPNGSGLATTNTADGNTPLRIGTRDDGVTRMKGDLAELLIYDRAITATERTNVINYLRAKYNLNVGPSVTIAATPPGPTINVGDVITLDAAANDSDGTIASVQFFANGGSLGTATVPPYSLRVTIDSPGTVQFTARAIDNAGAFSNSAPVTFSAVAGTPTTLTVTNGLQLWLKADAGTTVGPNGGVVQWADQSINGNHALQTDENLAPVLTNDAVNGRPSLRFDGVNDYLQVADSDSISITGDITTFFVLKFSDFVGFNAVWAKTTVNLPAPTDMYTQPGNGRLRLYRGNGVATSIQSSDSAQPFAAGTFLLGGFDMAGTAVRHYYNGLLNGTGSITVPITDANTPLLIGSRADLFTKMKGEIAEILIFDRALGGAERRQAELYLVEKYGLPPLVSVINNAPTVTILSPIGQILQAPGDVVVSASASDADGSIASVQLFANGVGIGTETSPPYEADLHLTYGGLVTLSAVVTDNFGMQTRSPSVAVCVQGPGAPFGLVSYWPLDGNANALVGTSGTLVGGPVAAPDRNGVAGGALSFDGALSQRVQVSGGGGLNNALRGTISMWVKWIGMQDAGFGNSFGAVLSRQQDGAFSDNIINLNNADPNNAAVQWRQNSAGGINITGTGLVGNDSWRHIAVTFTDTNSELFVDGLSEGTGIGGAFHNNAATALAIGAWTGGGGSYATAAIDDVAIWNRVLSNDEIQRLAAQISTPLALLIAPDCLSIARTATNVTVRWGSQTVLQSANDVAGPYSDVANGTNAYTTPLTNAASFYRLRSE